MVFKNFRNSSRIRFFYCLYGILNCIYLISENITSESNINKIIPKFLEPLLSGEGASRIGNYHEIIRIQYWIRLKEKDCYKRYVALYLYGKLSISSIRGYLFNYLADKNLFKKSCKTNLEVFRIFKSYLMIILFFRV